MNSLRRYTLVLAIYLNARGLAFVLFEGPFSPFDWGLKETRCSRKHVRLLARVRKLLDWYQPDVLVIQDTSPQGTHRTRRVTSLNAAIVELSSTRRIPIFRYSRLHVLEIFSAHAVPNKQALAEIIATYIPAFERYV
jgi:hypothetical protein